MRKLSPTDKDMPKVYERYQETIKTKMEAAKRASGPVMGGELEPRGMQRRPAMETKKTEESKKPAAQSSHPPNQKIGILKALLSVGALRPAFFILSKFPWMVSNHLDVSDLLLRILRVAIEPLYSPYSYSNRSGLENATTSKTAAHAMDSKPRKSVLTAWAPLPPPTATTDFVFFYVGWERWIPVCTTREELISVCEPFMRYTGVHLYRDIGFLTRLLRIGKAELQEVSRAVFISFNCV
jgi:THO complex subunit 2